MQIDKLTQKAAVNKFEMLYGCLCELGLCKSELDGFVRFGNIPRWILRKDAQLARELEMISNELKRILVAVMKVRRS